MRQLISGEDNRLSTARLAFWASLLVALLVILAEAFGFAAVSAGAYSLLGTIIVAMTTWVSGPRIAQYIGPQLGAIAGALSRVRSKDEIAARRALGKEDSTEPA